MKFIAYSSVCLLLVLPPSAAFEPVSLTLGVGLGAAGIYAGVEYLKCLRYECCTSSWLRLNLTGLDGALKQKLHGQHLVRGIVSKALWSHLSRSDPKKALVLSFHGWTGSGKNYVSKIIAEHLYKNGMKSKYVRQFIATLHFPHHDQVRLYQDNLRSWIRGNISECERSLFIFDEIDKMPPGVIDAIKPFIDYHEYVDGKNFRKAIFLFLSNTGGRDITAKALEFWKNGKDRESITMKDIEELVRQGAFNEKGGLKHSYIIDKNLIDFHVPFLPLERKHIKLCVEDEMKEQEIPYDQALVEHVVNELLYYPPDSRMFSTTGCKRIVSLLNAALNDY